MKTRLCFFCATAFLILTGATSFGDSLLAAKATNELGLDVFRRIAIRDGNLCLSPFAIANALAMTLAGADGETRQEMARVLHTPQSDDVVNACFNSLRRELAAVVEKSLKSVAEEQKAGVSEDPVTLAVAGQLFAQSGYDFRENFLALVKEYYGAPLEAVDYVNAAPAATAHINSWIAEQTGGRIRDLVPVGALDSNTRLVVANAIYLKAPWATAFSAELTQPRPFRIRGEVPVDVPTMSAHERSFGYSKRDGYTAVSMPYSDSDLQFLILLPDDPKGIHALEKKMSTSILATAAKLKPRELILYVPKFKIEPAGMDLGATLRELGMHSAFNQPPGSANFNRMAPRKPNDYLFLSGVFHKTFIAVDEVGTEAAAGNALPVTVYSAELLGKKPKPLVVKIDRPFLYAIQHVPSGACLFVGRVTDPR